MFHVLGAINSSLYCIIIFKPQCYEQAAIVMSISFFRKIIIYLTGSISKSRKIIVISFCEKEISVISLEENKLY